MSKWRWVLLILLVIVAVGTVGMASFTAKVKIIPGVSHAGVERLSGGQGLAVLMTHWGMPGTPLRVEGQELYGEQVSVVATDKMRTQCPEYDGARTQRWGMHFSQLKDKELVVYVWGTEDAWQGKQAGRELALYVAGCIKQAIRSGLEGSRGPALLTWSERLLARPLTIEVK
jgi:hypothetical protein